MSLSLLGDFCRCDVRLEVNLQVGKSSHKVMDLSPRQVAFVKSEMQKVEEDGARRPTEKVEAERIREKAESALTE